MTHDEAEAEFTVGKHDGMKCGKVNGVINRKWEKKKEEKMMKLYLFSIFNFLRAFFSSPFALLKNDWIQLRIILFSSWDVMGYCGWCLRARTKYWIYDLAPIEYISVSGKGKETTSGQVYRILDCQKFTWDVHALVRKGKEVVFWMFACSVLKWLE